MVKDKVKRHEEDYIHITKSGLYGFISKVFGFACFIVLVFGCIYTEPYNKNWFNILLCVSGFMFLGIVGYVLIVYEW